MVPGTCNGYREVTREEGMLQDILFSRKMTSADFPP